MFFEISFDPHVLKMTKSSKSTLSKRQHIVKLAPWKFKICILKTVICYSVSFKHSFLFVYAVSMELVLCAFYPLFRSKRFGTLGMS